MAKLRTKFPNWSFDTVTALQQAMLENLYRDQIGDDLDAPANPETLAVLGMTEADAARLVQEVRDKRAAEAAEDAEKAAEAERAAQLQAALEAAAMANEISTRSTRNDEEPNDDTEPPEPTPPPSYSSNEPPVSGDAGTHEYECTSCGYVLFPAAGREFKFFGEGFSCPQCGAGKDAFVDNGPVA